MHERLHASVVMSESSFCLIKMSDTGIVNTAPNGTIWSH
jgi:hypothetical protein